VSEEQRVNRLTKAISAIEDAAATGPNNAYNLYQIRTLLLQRLAKLKSEGEDSDVR